jgi:hypothetical protein
MKKVEKVLTVTAAGVLGIVGAAYAAVTTLSGDVVIQADANNAGSLVVKSGALALGENGVKHGNIRLFGLTSMPSWWMQNKDGGLLLKTDSTSNRSVRIQNEGTGLDANLNLTSGDVSVENGDVNIGGGGVVFEHGAPTSDAYITSNDDGDVIIQLGN